MKCEDKEFEKFLNDSGVLSNTPWAGEVKSAIFKLYPIEFKGRNDYLVLREGHSKEDRNAFFDATKKLFSDNGYSSGSYGVVWFKDGGWCELVDYGNEKIWEYRKVPSYLDIINSMST